MASHLERLGVKYQGMLLLSPLECYSLPSVALDSVAVLRCLSISLMRMALSYALPVLCRDLSAWREFMHTVNHTAGCRPHGALISAEGMDERCPPRSATNPRASHHGR